MESLPPAIDIGLRVRYYMTAVIKFLRFSVAVAPTGVLATLEAPAHASPPDPLWISGIYDDGDHDLVVIGILGKAASVKPFSPDVALSVQSVVAILHQMSERLPSSDALTSRQATCSPSSAPTPHRLSSRFSGASLSRKNEQSGREYSGMVTHRARGPPIPPSTLNGPFVPHVRAHGNQALAVG